MIGPSLGWPDLLSADTLEVLSEEPMSIAVRLPDDSLRQLPDGATGADLAAGIGARLLDAALAIRMDG
jgi:hypothetical protein